MEEKNEFERVFWLVIVLIAVVIVAGAAASYFLAGYGRTTYGYPYGYSMMTNYAYPLMAVFMVIPLLLLFLFIYWIIRIANGPHEVHHYYSGGPQAGGGQDRAREILDEKYAKGDITREQYLQMREDLSKR